jgi:hypothetical protein
VASTTATSKFAGSIPAFPTIILIDKLNNWGMVLAPFEKKCGQCSLIFLFNIYESVDYRMIKPQIGRLSENYSNKLI